MHVTRQFLKHKKNTETILDTEGAIWVIDIYLHTFSTDKLLRGYVDFMEPCFTLLTPNAISTSKYVLFVSDRWLTELYQNLSIYSKDT